MKKHWCCGYCRKEYDSIKEANNCPDCHKDDAKTKQEIKDLDSGFN